jgi:hypothetical protein
MLLVAAFAIYVIVTRRLRITRSMTVTGANARNFGIALLVLLIPFQGAADFLLRTFLPATARAWPIPQALYVGLFAAVVLSMAYYFGISQMIRTVNRCQTINRRQHINTYGLLPSTTSIARARAANVANARSGARPIRSGTTKKRRAI